MSVREKLDPSLEQVLKHIAGLPASAIERSSGVCASTVRAWRNGKTMSPMNKTLEFALRSAGYQRIIVKTGGR